MGYLQAITASLALSSLMGAVVSHPGETADQKTREIEAHHAAQTKARDAMGKCSESPGALALKSRAAERRAATVRTLREKRGIATDKPMPTKRDMEALEKWMAVDHDQSEMGYDLNTPPDAIFSANASCALAPEVIIGPYWVAGELMRQDVTEGEPGVPVHLDMQFIDMATCETIPSMLVDVWQANATGVYSGVLGAGMGGLATSFLRGVQETDADGVTEFDTVFPGHYEGRTNHIHIKTTLNATVLANGTYVYDTGATSHVGQLFFDQALVGAVEALGPYTANPAGFTSNVDDGISADQAADDVDPFVDYVLLGDGPQDGLLMWITVAVDTTAHHNDDALPAAYWYEDGGVETGLVDPYPPIDDDDAAARDAE